MGEREAERADVVRFLCGTASRIEVEARAEDAACASVGVASAITPKMREVVGAFVKAANAIERGDHVRPVERTPEVVLRAMLAAYERAAGCRCCWRSSGRSGSGRCGSWAARRR